MIIGLLCIGAVVWMITLMQRNVIFFKTVSQAVHDRSHEGTHSLRIGGAVVPGTIHQTSNGATFELTQGHVTVGVVLLSIIAWMASRRKFSGAYYTPVEISGLYWHFVDVIWIFLYPLLYLIQRYSS